MPGHATHCVSCSGLVVTHTLPVSLRLQAGGRKHVLAVHVTKPTTRTHWLAFTSGLAVQNAAEQVATHAKLLALRDAAAAAAAAAAATAASGVGDGAGAGAGAGAGVGVGGVSSGSDSEAEEHDEFDASFPPPMHQPKVHFDPVALVAQAGTSEGASVCGCVCDGVVVRWCESVWLCVHEHRPHACSWWCCCIASLGTKHRRREQ